ncbi:MAG: hypothetical protein KC635_25210 [Myxococcales bacterium]|nr:hypothetical protein [Myxococcales bacterium]
MHLDRALVTGLVVAALAAGLGACGEGGGNHGGDAVAAGDALGDGGGDDVVAPGTLCELPAGAAVVLPADDARHDEPTEWLYWTGHLQAEDGRWFGFQVTLLYAGAPGQGIIVGHRTLSDPASGRFRQHVDFGVEGGEVRADGVTQDLGGASVATGGGRDTLRSAFEDAELELELVDVKGPVVRHGSGYVDYGGGVYTWYYARPRMRATGTLRLGGETLAVAGTAWFDHQWGVLVATEGPRWDWLGAQLDDGRELMVYRLPLPGGGLVTFAELTDADCRTTHYDGGDVAVEETRTWEKPGTSCVYPVGWRVRAGDLVLEVDPVQDDQEVAGDPVSYWEGAATVSGGASGRAYVELVGYCGR